MSNPHRIHLILPAFNEGANLGPLFNSFGELPEVSSFRFHLVNDGSTDNTLDVLQQIDKQVDLKLINHTTNQGLSKTLQTGLLSAVQETGPQDIIVFMDADNTHLPATSSWIVSNVSIAKTTALCSHSILS